MYCIPTKHEKMNPDAHLILRGHSDTVKGIKGFAEALGAKTRSHCSDSSGQSSEVPFVTNTAFIEKTRERRGIVMASGAELIIMKRNRALQIANPGFDWRLRNPYELPFMGFKGALNLVSLWTDEILFKMWSGN